MVAHYVTPRTKHAFSLVELSIVLVILGLLIGGILSGQSLIRAAELRSVGTDYSRYYTATQTFRDKYFALPGDMNNATAFWGDDNANCPDGAVANGTPGTCNGNGNGILDWPAAGANLTGENYQYWKQLALAGLIEGNYTGLSTNCYYCTSLGNNVPRSKLSNSGWTAFYGASTTSTGGQFIVGNYGNISYTFGAQQNYTSGVTLTPSEAWNIDTKLDDGLAGQGKITPWSNTFHPNCSNLDTTASVYTLSYTSAACALVFKVGA
jgi:prepilin-type N-terminal cleavage/methylation domain-containing protein